MGGCAFLLNNELVKTSGGGYSGGVAEKEVLSAVSAFWKRRKKRKNNLTWRMIGNYSKPTKGGMKYE